MKSHPNSFPSPATLLLLAMLVWTWPLTAAPTTLAAPTAKTNSVVVIRSVFIAPTSPKDGRDPFFPESLRPFQVATSAVARTVELSSLIFKGVSGPPEHRLVIINNHTFSNGDEGEVSTASGRIRVRCVEIKANSVIIEAGGQRAELLFSEK